MPLYTHLVSDVCRAQLFLLLLWSNTEEDVLDPTFSQLRWGDVVEEHLEMGEC